MKGGPRVAFSIFTHNFMPVENKGLCCKIAWAKWGMQKAEKYSELGTFNFANTPPLISLEQ
jgi:hypothetical protein